MPFSEPLLCAPPFVAGLRIAESRIPAVAAVEPDRAEDLERRLRAARVGGAFWIRTDPSPKPTICRPADPAEALRLAASEDASAILFVLTGRRWPRSVGSQLARAGAAVLTRPFDPWSLLAANVTVMAHGDDPLLLFANVLARPVRPLSAGRFGDGSASEGVYRALVGEAAYRDPFTGHPAEPEEAIDLLGAWRRIIESNHGIAAVCGVARWKRREVAAMLWTGSPVPFVVSARAAAARAGRRGGAVAVWPSRAPEGLADACARARVPLRQIEDGFVRSAGLGAQLTPPLSIVVDASGMHFDPRQPSDLEDILQTAAFPPPLLARAERLMHRIVDSGISKYGVSSGAAPDLSFPGRRVVLVTGQVEDDLSVRCGGGGLSRNIDLLRRAREAEPDAVLLFKPHPDVESGHRKGAVPDAQALSIVDTVVRDVDTATLLRNVDAVHVLTSLAGFEALLRGREVVTHGSPFFAGWGLTRDLGPALPRRTRRLRLLELVAGALILYPRYLDPVTRLPCPLEVLLDRFDQGLMPRPGMLMHARRLQGALRRAMTILKGGR